MARSKHRKAHKQALNLYRDAKTLIRRSAQVGQPIEVGKGKFQIAPEVEPPHTIDVETTPVPLEWSGGDYTQVEQRILAQMSGGRATGKTEMLRRWEERCARHIQVLKDPELTGAARSAYKGQAFMDLYGGPAFLPTDTTVAPGLEEAKAIIDRYWGTNPEVAQALAKPPMTRPALDPSPNFMAQALRAAQADRNGNVFTKEALLEAFGPDCVISEEFGTLIVQGQVRNPEGLKALTEKLPYCSMGCTTDPPFVPCTPKKLTGEAQSHIEIGFHRDADGKPVFDEISLCPGPDPNGLTDLPTE